MDVRKKLISAANIVEDFVNPIMKGENLSRDGAGPLAKAGLQKISKKHPEVLNNLQEVIDSMKVVQTSDNRIKLESKTHFADVSRKWLGEERTPWLLTAYEKKESSATNNMMDTVDILKGMQNGTATPQDTASTAKIDNVLENSNEDEEKRERARNSF